MAVRHGYGKIVTDGLVLALDGADNNSYTSGSSTWYDVSGNGNNGTLINGTSYSSNNKGNLTFDGIDDKIEHTEILFTSSSSWTLSQWQYKPSGSYMSWQAFAGNSRFDPPSLSDKFGYFMWHSTGTALWWYGDFYDNTTYGVTLSIDFETAVGFDTWYKLDCVYDGNSQSLSVYINSNFITSGSVLWNTTLGASSMSFYEVGNAENRYFEGSIATHQIYNRALTASEVLQNFNHYKGRFNL